MKAYVKPELFYERYELSQYVASCDAKWNWTPGGCTISIPGMGNCFSTEEICVGEDRTKLEEYCYMNSTTGGLSTFIS